MPAEAKGAARARAAVKPIRIVGNHPSDEAPVELYDGRYGPYVKHGAVNATLPDRDQLVEALRQALEALHRDGTYTRLVEHYLRN